MLHFFLMSSCLTLVRPWKIHIIDICTGTSLVQGCEAVAPAVDIAMLDMQEKYPAAAEKVTREVLSISGDKDCNVEFAAFHDSIGRIWERIQASVDFTVLLSNGWYHLHFSWG